MTSISTPIHVAALGHSRLRFFAPPDGGREFPWIGLADAFECLAVPHDLCRVLTQAVQRDWRREIRTVATPDSIMILVPHFMMQGLVEAMTDLGHVGPELRMTYARAGATALGTLTRCLGPQEKQDYLGAAAAKNQDGDNGWRRP